MSRAKVNAVRVGLFVAGLALVGTTAAARRAQADTNNLQCWYFWWQDPQCTFCLGPCLPGGDCCITGGES